MDNLYSKFQPIEQIRWNAANIDCLMYAGCKNTAYQYSSHTPQKEDKFFFNLLQQPINMVTGRQRQTRKSITYIPIEGSDSQTTDQYTRLMMQANNKGGVLEAYSKGCEMAAICGRILAQPYLDFSSDLLQGDLKLKIWEYNAFLEDPFSREPDMSDSQFVWTQEYISKREAMFRFKDKENVISTMSSSPQRHGTFYFLPEHYNMARNDLMVLSHIWYKWKRKRKKIYNPHTNQFLDFTQESHVEEELRSKMPELEIVEVDIPSWKVAIVLNDKLMYQNLNPLGFDSCPFVPIYWNYDPHLNQFECRSRSLTRTMIDSQFLLNRRICINHDQSESSINTGYLRKVGAVANEENLKQKGQGLDVLINDDYEMTDFQKILPNQVPPSNLELANQLKDLIFSTSGVNMENWGFEEDKTMSGLALMLKQGGNLIALQKYFDQWDNSLKLIGNVELQIILNNWNEFKVAQYLGEQPSPHFFSKIFAKYHVLVEEGLNTPTQKQMQFMQLLELNQATGGAIPPEYLIKNSIIQGSEDLQQFLTQQREAQSAAAQEKEQLEQTVLEAKLKESYSKAAMNIAQARERHGRAESNIGLFEERLSQITQNRADAVKSKMEALNKLLEAAQKYGQLQTNSKQAEIEQMGQEESIEEDREKMDAKQTSLANDFIQSILQGKNNQNGQQAQQMQSQGE